MSSYNIPDLSSARLAHSSYDFADPSSNLKTAMEVADTLSDHFALARDNKLSQDQLDAFTTFLDEEHIFKIAVTVVPEVAQMAGQDAWVSPDEEKATSKRSAQTAHILHAVAHLEPRSRRLSRPPEPSQAMHNDLVAGANGTAADGPDNTTGPTTGSERIGPTTKVEVEQMGTIGEAIRERGNKGRESWAERYST